MTRRAGRPLPGVGEPGKLTESKSIVVTVPISRVLLIFSLLLIAAPPVDAWARGKGKRAKKVKRYRCRHTVLPGENLRAIAQRYHISVRRLRAINSLKGDAIRAGRRLGVVTRYPCPQRYRTTHVVRRGENLNKIAAKYKMSRRMLRGLNPKVKRWLRAGQRLTVIVDGPDPNREGRGLVQLHSGPGYIVRNPKRAFGTMLAVSTMIEVFADYHRRHPKAAPLRVDDISREEGGKLKPHVSHRTGRDVDIRYPLKVPTRAYVKARPSTLDVRRTWELIERFLDTEDVIYVFVDYRLQRVLYEYAKNKRGLSEEKLKSYFQYPRRRTAMTGIIRHEPGHATHMHVRFRKMKKKGSPNS